MQNPATTFLNLYPNTPNMNYQPPRIRRHLNDALQGALENVRNELRRVASETLGEAVREAGSLLASLAAQAVCGIESGATDGPCVVLPCAVASKLEDTAHESHCSPSHTRVGTSPARPSFDSALSTSGREGRPLKRAASAQSLELGERHLRGYAASKVLRDERSRSRWNLGDEDDEEPVTTILDKVWEEEKSWDQHKNVRRSVKSALVAVLPTDTRDTSQVIQTISSKSKSSVHQRSILSSIVRSQLFDYTMGVVVMLNAVSMGVHVDYSASQQGAKVPLGCNRIPNVVHLNPPASQLRVNGTLRRTGRNAPVINQRTVILFQGETGVAGDHQR